MCQELHKRGQFITLETEGSSFVPDCNIDLLSLSPKLSNSLPRIGTKTPKGELITEKHLKRHEKSRRNYDAMRQWIDNSKDYQFKPVIGNISQVEEIETLAKELNVSLDKFWVMAAGGTKEVLQKNLIWTLNLCVSKGWNFVPRFHILMFDDQREV